MRIIGHQSVRVRPRYVAAAPLTNQAKVAAINTLLLKCNKAPVTYVPPSQIVLTPAQPVQGPNFFGLQGEWWPADQAVYLDGHDSDYLFFNFPALAQGTYLLDVSVSGTGDWEHGASVVGGSGTLTVQQGHLLYPFVGGGWFQLFLFAPADGPIRSWVSAELTKVS